MAGRAPTWQQLLRLSVVAAAGAYALAVIRLAEPGAPPTTYGAASGWARAADLAAGLGLLVAGSVALLEPQRRRLGALALAAGAVWFAPDWEGWAHGAPVVRSLGALAAPAFVALVFHAVLAAPSGRLGSRARRWAVAAVYASVAAASLARALVRDPFLDAACWRNCLDATFLVHADPGLARAFGRCALVTVVVAGAALAPVAIRTLALATPAGRRALLPIAAPGALVGTAAAASALAVLREPLENPAASPFSTLFLLLSATVVAFAAGIAWSAIRVRRTRASVVHLAGELAGAAQPGGLQAGLAAALGDTTLTVAYRLDGTGEYVDAAGREVPGPAALDGRAVTTIARGGRTVAWVAHDAALLDGPGLGREIGAAARLAVDNERLQAEVLARLEALRASRARLVEAEDEARRRLERNLHDGAQQQLLALVFQLRLARAEASDDPSRAAALASAEQEADAALDDLRRLARGIHPAILTEAGLGPALATLAETAPLPVELTDGLDGRLAAPVEAAAYVAVVEAVEDAAARGASFVSVDARCEDGRLALLARDDGAARTSPLTHVADRVGALGGTVELGEAVMRAEIPCV